MTFIKFISITAITVLIIGAAIPNLCAEEKIQNYVNYKFAEETPEEIKDLFYILMRTGNKVLADKKYAIEAMAKEDYAKAIINWEEIIKNLRLYHPAYFPLTQCYEETGQEKTAEEVFLKGLALAETDYHQKYLAEYWLILADENYGKNDNLALRHYSSAQDIFENLICKKITPENKTSCEHTMERISTRLETLKNHRLVSSAHSQADIEVLYWKMHIAKD